MAERIAFSYQKEDGSSVRVIISDGMDASDAMDTLEAFISLKRTELMRTFPPRDGDGAPSAEGGPNHG